MSFNKNLKGECEPDLEAGVYHSEEDCRADEQRPVYESEFERYVAMEAITADDDLFFELAPSDRVQFLRIRYGIEAPIDRSYHIGSAIYTRDYVRLYLWRLDTMAYLQQQLDTFDFTLLEILRQISSLILGRSIVFNLQQFRLQIHSALSSVPVDEAEITDVTSAVDEALGNQEIRFYSRLLVEMTIREQWPVFRERYGFGAL